MPRSSRSPAPARRPARAATTRAGPPEGARERLLAAADELFYRRGIRNVGIDEIIARAGVAKASLYKHFASKDELVAEYVRGRDARFGEWFSAEVEARGATPRERLLAVFDVLGTWFSEETFRGCAFQNATAELADRTHPAHAAVLHHKQGVRAYLRELARRADLADPDGTAAQLSVLAEGAIVSALIEGTAAPARTARAAAEILLR